MKNLIFAGIHVLGLFLLYGALGVMVSWFFDYLLPLPAKLNNSVFFAAGVFIILPMIGVLSVKFEGWKINKILGYVYIITWIIVIIRTLAMLFSK